MEKVMKYTEFNNWPYESHRIVYDLIQPNTSIFDLGCATGYFGKELKKKNCVTVGVEQDASAATIAKKYLQNVFILDLEQPEKMVFPNNKFDYILMLDVLEHLRNRVDLLSKISRWLKPEGRLIISTPNITHISIRLKLLFGDFSYTEMGILDHTHVHFFTRKTLEEELNKSGWRVDQWFVSSDFGQIPFLGRILRRVPKYFQHLITDLSPSLLGVQWIVICQKA